MIKDTLLALFAIPVATFAAGTMPGCDDAASRPTTLPAAAPDDTEGEPSSVASEGPALLGQFNTTDLQIPADHIQGGGPPKGRNPGARRTEDSSRQ